MSSSLPKTHDLVVKLLLIGDSGAGKTSLLLRYCDDAWTSSFITTIGIDFKIRNVDNVLGQRVKLQIWDTAGQERFRTITTAYYRGAEGIVLVYDVTDAKTFRSVRAWLKQVDTHAAEGVCKMLIGNKCDVDGAHRAVQHEEGARLAAEFGIPFLETSAKEDINVERAFGTITTSVVQKKTAAPPSTGTDDGRIRLDGASAGRSAGYLPNACCSK